MMCELMAFSATLNAETRQTCRDFFKRQGAELPVQTDLYARTQRQPRGAHACLRCVQAEMKTTHDFGFHSRF